MVEVDTPSGTNLLQAALGAIIGQTVHIKQKGKGIS